MRLGFLVFDVFSRSAGVEVFLDRMLVESFTDVLRTSLQILNEFFKFAHFLLLSRELSFINVIDQELIRFLLQTSLSGHHLGLIANFRLIS